MHNVRHVCVDDPRVERRWLFNGGKLSIGADRHTLALGRGHGAGKGGGILTGQSEEPVTPTPEKPRFTSCTSGDCTDVGKSFTSLDFMMYRMGAK